MNVTEAAARVGVSRRTIFRWIGRGWLRTTRVDHPGGAWRHDISIDALIDADDRRYAR